ncbi:MAG: hypothetical protein AB1489_39680, partial [Acidobacteriota bacterium]
IFMVQIREGYSLDLSLEICAGSIHNLGDIIFLCRLRASTYLPNSDKAKLMILYRDRDYSLLVKEDLLEIDRVNILIDLIEQMELLDKKLDIESKEANITGWQQLSLLVKINERASKYELILQYGGFGGKDAEILRAVLKYLFQLCCIDMQPYLVNILQ